MNQEKWTTARLKALKGKGKIVSLTAYDYATARLLDEAGLHVVLVGDSLAMTMLGYKDTLPVTLDEMLHHTKAVVRGVEKAHVVADMPFLSFQVSPGQAVDNAGRFLKEAGADSVKIEGGAFRAETIQALVQNGIPVMGHIGLTPQNVREKGGYQVQGRTEDEARQLLEDARILEEAGLYSLVLEGVPAAVAERITESLKIPTIGIGAGPGCDGQVLVVHDLLGLYPEMKPKFVKCYADIGSTMRSAFAAYKNEVESGGFPGDEHAY
jgi:3-methyl-2-oxobutanoate hydroxymethyltransferase